MGNNLYADLLPYKDWFTMNNAQRMHEAGTEYAFVFLPNAFICALSYPRYAATLTGLFALSRFSLMQTYTDFRGFNAAMIHEEFMRFECILALFGAFASGVRITRVFQPLSRALKPYKQSLGGMFRRRDNKK